MITDDGGFQRAVRAGEAKSGDKKEIQMKQGAVVQVEMNHDGQLVAYGTPPDYYKIVNLNNCYTFAKN